MIHFTFISHFPEIIEQYFNCGIIGKALENDIFSYGIYDLREYGEGSYKKTDDTLYGGGRGMLMMADPLDRIISELKADDAKEGRAAFAPFYLSPAGQTFDTALAAELAEKENIVLLCGRYEGVDARLLEKYDFAEISLGDFVLSGGEAAALCIADAVLRRVEGVLPDSSAYMHESFSLDLGDFASEKLVPESERRQAAVSSSLLEERQYTKPFDWQGRRVPEVLLSGHHKKIERFRQADSMLESVLKRPDLPDYAAWSEKDWYIFLEHAAAEKKRKSLKNCLDEE